jgi:hypothetical protein
MFKPHFREFRSSPSHIVAVFDCEPYTYYDWNRGGWRWKAESAFDKPSLEVRIANLEKQGLDVSEERSVMVAWPE